MQNGPIEPNSPVIEETFCCGHKRCPRLRVYPDGSGTLDDDGKEIAFTPEQLKAMQAMLGKVVLP
jgi:hypothetical protein